MPSSGEGRNTVSSHNLQRQRTFLFLKKKTVSTRYQVKCTNITRCTGCAGDIWAPKEKRSGRANATIPPFRRRFWQKCRARRGAFPDKRSLSPRREGFPGNGHPQEVRCYCYARGALLAVPMDAGHGRRRPARAGADRPADATRPPASSLSTSRARARGSGTRQTSWVR